MTVFASTTVDALDVEIEALAARILADDRFYCPECGGLCLAPFVDINPARIREPLSRDRVELFLNRQDTTVLPTTQLRIACPTPAVAEHTAALLRGLGAPPHAIRLGGFQS